MGLWKDSGDRAMPIKMNVNPGNSNQVHDAFDTLIREMCDERSTTGFIAAQSYNQMHWSTDPNESGYKKHHFIGMEPSDAIRSSWSKREHRNDNLTFEGFEGVMNILGGDWQNAVYKVEITSTLPPKKVKLNGHWFSFKKGGNPSEIVDRIEARQNGSTV
jgi:hypothetical protein